MSRYIISDTHLGHGNLIDYVNRPYDNVEEMNEAIVSNWNSTVDDEDTVIHCGDIRHHPSPLMEKDWLDKLNGRILLVEGNHDSVGANFPYNHVQNCTISHGKYQIYIEHQRVDGVPGFQIHGHTHQHHPFIDYEKQKINVSVEVIDYTPVAVDEIVRILQERQRFQTLEQARESIGYDPEMFQ